MDEWTERLKDADIPKYAPAIKSWIDRSEREGSWQEPDHKDISDRSLAAAVHASEVIGASDPRLIPTNVLEGVKDLLGQINGAAKAYANGPDPAHIGTLRAASDRLLTLTVAIPHTRLKRTTLSQAAAGQAFLMNISKLEDRANELVAQVEERSQATDARADELRGRRIGAFPNAGAV